MQLKEQLAMRVSQMMVVDDQVVAQLLEKVFDPNGRRVDQPNVRWLLGDLPARWSYNGLVEKGFQRVVIPIRQLC